MNLVTISTAPAEPGQANKTRGARVTLADGTPLHGVTAMYLTAEPNDVWRAEIHCVCRVEDLEGVQALIKATALKPRAYAPAMPWPPPGFEPVVTEVEVPRPLESAPW